MNVSSRGTNQVKVQASGGKSRQSRWFRTNRVGGPPMAGLERYMAQYDHEPFSVNKLLHGSEFR